MGNAAIENPARRNFLRTAPIATAAGFMLTDASLFSSPASAQQAAASGEKYELIGSQSLQDDIKALQDSPGNKNLYRDPNFSIVLTSEKAASAKEFEWHEFRDHIFYIFDGSTTFELGGKPQGAHSPQAGEWLAPSSQGAATVKISKGDTLVIPRGTPHRRITPESVTFTLIAPMTSRKG